MSLEKRYLEKDTNPQELQIYKALGSAITQMARTGRFSSIQAAAIAKKLGYPEAIQILLNSKISVTQAGQFIVDLMAKQREALLGNMRVLQDIGHIVRGDYPVNTLEDYLGIRNQEINRFIEAQYRDRMDTLKVFGLYDPDRPHKGDVRAPEMAQVQEILARQITPEQTEVLRRMERPVLQLIPITSMDSYITALDRYKPMERQENTFVSPWHKGAFVRADERDEVKTNKTITGWRIAVTEGAKEPKLLEGDDINKTLRERAAWFAQEYGRKGISGVDLKRVLLLMMDSLKEGKPMNDYWKQDGTWTFVNGEPEKDGFVSGVDWGGSNRQVSLAEAFADRQFGSARLRASVVVDVPKTA